MTTWRTIIKAYPDRFVGAASIDPTNRTTACAQISAAIKAGFRAINIEPGSYPVPMMVDDRRLYPIYAHCEDVGVPGDHHGRRQRRSGFELH